MNSIVKLLHADGFFDQTCVTNLKNVTVNLNFVEKEYGSEIENFNLVPPNLDPVFSKLLAEDVVVDEDNSGIFRKPILNIHFESFESLNEWCFIIALEPTTFNLYKHQTGAESALDGYKFNYKNLFEWDYYTNLLLSPNQGVIFRPWLFHSVSGGLIQVYRLKKKDQVNENVL